MHAWRRPREWTWQRGPWMKAVIYVLLNGGVPGNVGTLLSTLQSQDKVSTTFTILKDLASMCLTRHARGEETMLVVSRS